MVAIDLQVLQSSVDPDGKQESEFRLLVNRKFVKYVTIEAGLFNPDDLRNESSFISLLPPLPHDDWNTGHISRHSRTGEAYFSKSSKEDLPSINNTWHPVRVDHLELCIREKLGSNVYEATCPRFGSPVIIKIARFPWEIPWLDGETTAYEFIEDEDIGPEFLGHLTEEGRVIGFIISRVTDFRHATPEDISVCQQTLSKLHKMGIKHGDTSQHNLLIHDGKAILIDFDNASKVESDAELEDELNELPDRLRGKSRRRGKRSAGVRRSLKEKWKERKKELGAR